MRVPNISRSSARRAVRIRQAQRRVLRLAGNESERRHLIRQGALALAAVVILGGLYAVRGGRSHGPDTVATALPAAQSASGKEAAAPAAAMSETTKSAAEPGTTVIAGKADPASGSTPKFHFDAPPAEPAPAAGTKPSEGPAAAAAASTAHPAQAPATTEAPGSQPSAETKGPALSFRDERAIDPSSAPAADAAAAGKSPPQTAAPTVSFRDERGLETKPRFEAPAIPPPDGKSGPTSFRDERALDTKPRFEAPAIPAPEAGASFRDDHSLDAKPRFDVPGTPPAATFQDDRRLAVPSFADSRSVDAPSFKDDRPAASVTFEDKRPIAAEGVKSAASAGAAQSQPRMFDAGDRLSDLVKSEPAAALAGAPTPQVAAATPAPATPAPAPQAAPSASPPATNETAAASGDGLPTLVALSPGQLKVEGIACVAPEVGTDALDGGLMRMHITANCHPNEFVQISYGGAEFIRKLNSYGALDYDLDCFAGSSSAVEVRFADGVTRQVPVNAKDLDKVSKIAVVWRAGVNLDLHVFEYAAKFGESGHYWSATPSSFTTAQVQSQADQRGHGFLSSIDDEKTLGDKLEVYTFLHNDQQTTGAISLALDNATRGETPSGPTCGQGALAEIGFQVSILPRNGQVTRQSGVLTRVDCGIKLSHEARFNQSAMPGLRIRR